MSLTLCVCVFVHVAGSYDGTIAPPKELPPSIESLSIIPSRAFSDAFPRPSRPIAALRYVTCGLPGITFRLGGQTTTTTTTHLRLYHNVFSFSGGGVCSSGNIVEPASIFAMPGGNRFP